MSSAMKSFRRKWETSALERQSCVPMWQAWPLPTLAAQWFVIGLPFHLIISLICIVFIPVCIINFQLPCLYPKNLDWTLSTHSCFVLHSGWQDRLWKLWLTMYRVWYWTLPTLTVFVNTTLLCATARCVTSVNLSTRFLQSGLDMHR